MERLKYGKGQIGKGQNGKLANLHVCQFASSSNPKPDLTSNI